MEEGGQKEAWGGQERTQASMIVSKAHWSTCMKLLLKFNKINQVDTLYWGCPWYIILMVSKSPRRVLEARKETSSLFLHCWRITLLVIVFLAASFIFLSDIHIYLWSVLLVLFWCSVWGWPGGCFVDEAIIKLTILLSQSPPQTHQSWNYKWLSLFLTVDSITLSCSERFLLWNQC